MNDAIRTVYVNDKRIDIVYDEFPDNPRDWDNLTHMVCWHPRYRLGDEQPKCDPAQWYAAYAEQCALIKPLYLFDHTRLSISIYDFHDRWDSGQVGWIYVTREAAAREPGLDLEALIQADVAVYDAYLAGEVYGFVIRDANDEELDACYGFYGMDEAISEAKRCI